MSLNLSVGGFAQHAGLGEIQKQLAGEDQSARRLQVLHHTIRVDQQLFNESRGLSQQVIDQNGRIGQDYPFGRGVRDVALMPKNNVFERHLGVSAYNAGKTTDLLTRDRVSFVRHRARTLLLL